MFYRQIKIKLIMLNLLKIKLMVQNYIESLKLITILFNYLKY